MRSESKRWNPAHWSNYKVGLFTRRVVRQAFIQLDLMIGPYEAALSIASLHSTLAGELSRAELHRRGLTTLGDLPPLS